MYPVHSKAFPFLVNSLYIFSTELFNRLPGSGIILMCRDEYFFDSEFFRLYESESEHLCGESTTSGTRPESVSDMSTTSSLE